LRVPYGIGEDDALGFETPRMDRRDANLGYFNRDAARDHGARTAIVDLSRSPPVEISHGELGAETIRFIVADAGRWRARPSARAASTIPAQ
jgi:hypothetical protein